MAAEDIHVRLCLQDIIKLDLEAKALIQVLQKIVAALTCTSNKENKKKFMAVEMCHTTLTVDLTL